MQNDQSSYSRWSWIIALILAIILCWMYLKGKGPNNACCHPAEQSTAPITEVMPTKDVAVTESFSFSASETEFTGNGDANNISWINDIDALKALLSGGFMANGDNTTILLSGSAESEEAKQQKGDDAQIFFGADFTIDNQIIVAEPIEEAPEIAKLYFDVGFHRLPPDGLTILETTIAWLNDHPDTKAIISGFHDPTGDLASNQKLAKKRAQSTYDALVAAGIPADRIEMRKPISTDGGGALSEARRVEVLIE